MDTCFHAYVQWTLVLQTPCYYGYGCPAIVENSQPPGKTHKEMISINSYYYGCSLIHPTTMQTLAMHPSPPPPPPGATINFFPLAIAYILFKILTHIIYIKQHYNKGK